jgi:uncharacterized DUF497 family protein
MFATIIWDDEPGGNVEHLAEHGITPEEAEEVMLNDEIPTAVSASSGEPCKFGHTSTGKHIIVVWNEVDDDPLTIYPATAYEVPEPA